MSLSLSFTGKSSVLTACYFPALDLSDDDYELGLTNFETYNTIPNINSTNNKFYYDDDDKTIVIPEGSYELSVIDRYMNAAISKRRRIDQNKRTSDDDKNDEGREGHATSDHSRQRKHHKKRDQVRASSQFHETEQYRFAPGILIIVHVTTEQMAHVRWTREYHEREHHSGGVQYHRGCVQQRRTGSHDTRVFPECSSGI
ncbi:hypothetical protein P5V15_005884 [Pogonomyrmex californicus]